MRSLVLFNNKGGVGKTTLTFHLAHIFARLVGRVVLLDYDPQCNLTALALGEETLVSIWESEEKARGGTVARCLDPVRRGVGDVREPLLVEVADNLWILPGDLVLSRFEQELAEGWGKLHAHDNDRAVHVTTALCRLAEKAAAGMAADLVLIDVGPHLGALNRSALLAADKVVLPVAPDLFSLQGLKNVGPTLREWREDWRRAIERRTTAPEVQSFQPRGYVVQQHLARVDRPAQGYQGWARQIPSVFYEHVLDAPPSEAPASAEDDPWCLGFLKHFASLVPLAQQARKPIFDLKQADGVGGGQLQAVVRARQEFVVLAAKVHARCWGPTPAAKGDVSR